MPRNSWTALAMALIATATTWACDPCEPEACGETGSDFMLKAPEGPLPSGVYAWNIDLDGEATTVGECHVPELGTTVQCREGLAKAKAVSRDLEIYGLKIDLTYVVEGEATRPHMIRAEISRDDELVLSESYEIEYEMGNTCTGFCPDATVFGIIEDVRERRLSRSLEDPRPERG